MLARQATREIRQTNEFMSIIGNGLKTFKYQNALDLDGNAAGTMD